MQLPSKILENAVESFGILPGIGKKTALRFVLSLLKEDQLKVERLAKHLVDLASKVDLCKQCHNVCEGEFCSICLNPSRNRKLICVVEDLRDVLAIESTYQYQGLYHVLGGVISPMDGIGPSDLNIASLESRAQKDALHEVIFALRTTMEGDTTNYFLHKKLKPYTVKTSVLSRGISVGDELAYADELTLGNSIKNRQVFEP